MRRGAVISPLRRPTGGFDDVQGIAAVFGRA
jgi:hypothetical protein